jgi:hypothetical protein
MLNEYFSWTFISYTFHFTVALSPSLYVCVREREINVVISYFFLGARLFSQDEVFEITDWCTAKLLSVMCVNSCCGHGFVEFEDVLGSLSSSKYYPVLYYWRGTSNLQYIFVKV